MARLTWVLLPLLASSLAVAAPRRPAQPGALVLPADRVVETADPLVAARTVLGARQDLALARVAVSLTGEHVTFQRLAADGTPLLGAEIAVHFRKRGPLRYQARQIDQTALDLPVLLEGSRRHDEADARAAALALRPGDVLAVKGAALLESSARARAGWRVVVAQPTHEWEIWVDGETGRASVRRDLLVTVEGSGFVYRPNPITTSGDRSLRDNDDADSPILKAQRQQVTLQGLDGSGFLRGEWVDARSMSTRAQEGSLLFDYERGDDRFEEVNAYHHIDRTQRYLQSLGYTGAKGILNRSFVVVANGRSDDNSHYSPTSGDIVLGSGGVDDGEDGDVIIHEYGHAIQFAITPAWTALDEAGALGEGFGDLIAYLVPNETTPGITRACLAPWDATSYSSTGCLRRVDGTKHYPEFVVSEPHEDGEIWSGAVFDLMAVAQLSAADMTRLLVEHQYELPGNATQPQAAAALLAADQELFAGAHAEAIRRVMTFHGLLDDVEPAVGVGARTAQVTHALDVPNIDNFTDQTVSFTEDGAETIVLHFASIDMEQSAMCRDMQCDRIYVYDAEGRLYGRLGGKQEDVYAPVVKGDTVVLRWVTDGDTESVGFKLDRIETYKLGTGTPGDDGGCDCRVGGGRTTPGALAGVLLFGLGLLLVRRAGAGAPRRRPRSR